MIKRKFPSQIGIYIENKGKMIVTKNLEIIVNTLYRF